MIAEQVIEKIDLNALEFAYHSSSAMITRMPLWS